jgi:hypothetical protein
MITAFIVAIALLISIALGYVIAPAYAALWTVLDSYLRKQKETVIGSLTASPAVALAGSTINLPFRASVVAAPTTIGLITVASANIPVSGVQRQTTVMQLNA